jgi:hypothetical protein
VTGKDKVAALAPLHEGDVTIPAGRIQGSDALVLADRRQDHCDPTKVRTSRRGIAVLVASNGSWD